MHATDEVGTLEDQLAIEQLIYRYQHAFDSGDDALFAECFAPEAILTGVNLTWQGDFAKRLRDMKEAGQSIPEDRKITVRHYMFNHFYEVNGEKATGMTYCWGSFASTSKFRDMYIRYRDELVKHAGRWRFQKREYELLCYTEPVPIRHLALDREEH